MSGVQSAESAASPSNLTGRRRGLEAAAGRSGMLDGTTARAAAADLRVQVYSTRSGLTGQFEVSFPPLVSRVDLIRISSKMTRLPASRTDID